MRWLFISTFVAGFAALIQGCDDEKACGGTYHLTTQIDVKNTDGGDATFVYNADGLLQKVSGRHQRDDSFFYDAQRRLIRTETGEENGATTLLFTYDTNGRVVSMYQDAPFIDSTVFVYDDNDRIIKTLFYRANPEVLYYYDIEYPDAATVKKSVYLRDADTKELELGYVDTYTLDDHPRPHPQEYYLYQFPLEEVFLPHNPLTIHSTYNGGNLITKSFKYNSEGYVVSEDDVFRFAYSCREN